MSIQTSDLAFHLSGGASNSNADASLGGLISSVAVSTSALHNLFDKVTGDESSAGDTEYRCIYVKNNHATLTLESAKVFIKEQTPAPGTSVEMGLGSAAIGGTEQTIANESTAPTGVTFTALVGKSNALMIGDLGPGESKAVFLKRIVNAGSQAYNNDGVTIELVGDTAAAA